MVSRLEDQTCHPCNPHFGWWPLKMKWGLQWRTKWGLHGWHECRATGALGEAGKSSLVSGGAEMWRNSISYHPALYIANCLFWKARKKNFQLFRALKPQPTSWVGWGTWLHVVGLILIPRSGEWERGGQARSNSHRILPSPIPNQICICLSICI